MERNSLKQQIEAAGLIPVVKFHAIDEVLPTAKALLDGGISCIEVTYRTSIAGEAIRTIKESYPSMLVAAGTILNEENAREAVSCGADFLVSPGLNPSLVEFVLHQLKIPFVPGVSTPSEVDAAQRMGLSLVKFFPAEAAGGTAMLKSLAGPYPAMTFMPTGGISMENVVRYLELSNVCGCGGSFIVNTKDPEATCQIARLAFRKTLNLRLGHIGLYNGSDGEAERTAKLLADILQLPYDDRGGAVFVGNQFEVLKSHGRGKNGHIQILTSSIERAEGYFLSLGLHFAKDSLAYDADNRLTLAYFEEELSGMTLHLSRG